MGMRKGKFLNYLVILLLAAFLSGCNSSMAARQLPASTVNEFSLYEELSEKYTPAVKSYKVAGDLSNVTNRAQFQFSFPARQLLQQNAFVVVPGEDAEFFQVYDSCDNIPNFITSDALLHTYHLHFDHLLKNVEKRYLIPELKQLNTAMLTASQAQYDSLQGSPWENAARRNLAFFAVAGRLSDQPLKIPAEVEKEVKQELSLIAEHSQVKMSSPVMNMGNTGRALEKLDEDYTQYVPRGHYTESQQLQNYFKTMMWYGRLTFRVKNADESRSAVLIALALSQADIQPRWEKIYTTSQFFAGGSDDINYCQYHKLLSEVYGAKISLAQLKSDTGKWQSFIQKASALKPPAIVSMPLYDQSIQPNTEKETLGFRFMGQRYNLDAEILQKLVYDKVQANPEGKYRMLPTALDVPAAMGSKEANTILRQTGEMDYRNYPENMAELKQHVSGLEKKAWVQSLYGGWLYGLLTLTEKKGPGYPAFMLNQAWARKELNTYLGSWTELKHDTILYTKQAYVLCGGVPQLANEKGYVEPNPELYGRLAALTRMTRVGLQQRGYLFHTDKASLQQLEETCLTLQTISARELNNEPLTDQDYTFIRDFRGPLWQLWKDSLTDRSIDDPDEYSAAVAADVVTSPHIEKVLEEATGGIDTIYVIVPINGKLQIARGGVYSYYEFPWPASDRLTDQKWREMLKSGKSLLRPEWTKAFIGYVD